MRSPRDDYEGLTILSVRVRGGLNSDIQNKNKFRGNKFAQDPKLSVSQYPKRVGNSFNLVKNSFTAKQRNDFCHFVSVRDTFFSNRVTEHWNKLNDNVVNAPLLNSSRRIHGKWMLLLGWGQIGSPIAA